MVTVNLALSNRPQFVNWKANPTRTGFSQALTFKLQGCTLSFCLTNPSFESRSSVKWCTKLSLLGFIYNKPRRKLTQLSQSLIQTQIVAGAYNQEWTYRDSRLFTCIVGILRVPLCEKPFSFAWRGRVCRENRFQLVWFVKFFSNQLQTWMKECNE